MKRLAFVIFFISAVYFCDAQSVALNYYYTGSGRNLTATFSKRTGNNKLGVGLGYNINSIRQSDDQNNVYYRRLYATKAYHHLNFNVFYNRYVFTNLAHIKVYVFYDFQIKYSTTRTSSYVPWAFDSSIVANTPDEKVLYRNIVNHYGPFWWIENTLGVGFEVDITKSWYLTQKVGLGLHILYGDKFPPLLAPKVDIEYYSMLNVGIGFRLDKER